MVGGSGVGGQPGRQVVRAREVEQGIREVFADRLDDLAVPPARLARIIRTGLHGLVVELSLARTPEDFQTVEESYRDMRALFERVVAPARPPRESP